MMTDLPPQEIQRRLDAHECLRCLAPIMDKDNLTKAVDIDSETGFPYQHCFGCREWLRRNKPKVSPSPSKWNKEHKQEWLDNLDRLMRDGA